MKRLRILLIDDQKLFADSLKQVLEGAKDSIASVEVAYDGTRAIPMVRAFNPDVVLMDVHMPGMNGIETAEAVKAISPETRVVMLSAFGYTEYVDGALKAGADGYLLKDISPEKLLDAVIDVVRDGFTVLSGEVKDTISGRGRRRVGKPTETPDWLYNLSLKERKILCLISRGQSNSEIAESINVAEQTIRNYISTLYSKMNVKNRFEAIRLAIESKIEDLILE
jgi:DNA-binding NarL/FixJ family response regulator